MSESNTAQLNEPELPLNYPIHIGYLYVLESISASNDEIFKKVISSEVEGTVSDLLQDLRIKGEKGIKTIHKCDISGRKLWHLIV